MRTNLVMYFTVMQKYPEVPQWWYLILFIGSLAVGIGCSVGLIL